MVLGQTGSGKTLLLNALANYHMGVEFQDSFRYMLIKEDIKQSNDDCGTKDIIEYHLKPHGSNSPLILIDVPGFGTIEDV